MDLPASFFLQELILRAIDLDDLREAGASFPYPGTLSSVEWMAVKVMGRARRIEQAKRAQPKGEGEASEEEKAAGLK